MKLIWIIAFVLVMAASAFAANEKQYSDGPTGVTVTLNDAGAIKSMVASGESKLASGDENDVLAATQKAALQAKAKISVFISVSMSSNEVMDDLSKIASTKTTAPVITTTSSSPTRQSLETQRKIIRNNSDAILNGLVIVKTEINKDKKNVTVVLSTDDKLMSGAVVPSDGASASKPASAAPAAKKK